MEAKRTPDGGWYDFVVTYPAGEALTLYIGPERSLANRRLSWHVAAAVRVLRAGHPSLDLEARRSDGTVLWDGKVLVLFEYQDRGGTVAINWNVAALQDAGADPHTVRTDFATEQAASRAQRRPTRG